MATRSMIGYINKNNRVKLGYCHYDGDLEHNGIILQNYYNNMEIVKNLLNIILRRLYTIDLIKTLFLEMWSFLKRIIE